MYVGGPEVDDKDNQWVFVVKLCNSALLAQVSNASYQQKLNMVSSVHHVG